MKAKTKKELLALYKKKHGKFYDYSKIDLDNKIDGKIIIICPAHGEFLQNHYDHISAGCPECAKIRKKEKSSKILVKNLEHLKELVDNNFDLSLAQYKNSSSSLLVKCLKHDRYFKNSTYNLVRGAGCSECKKEKIRKIRSLGTDEFIERAINLHGNRYDYSLVHYKTLIDTIDIICKIHGKFKQKPREHLKGSQCQLCSSTSISAISQVWLDSLGLDLIHEHPIKYDKGYYTVDGYDPKTNTVYEFHGDYWHGNPKIFNGEAINVSVDKQFKVLYNNTILKEQHLKNLGYNLVTIWENDFNVKISKQINDETGSKTVDIRPYR
jgi:hypothetical protein